MEARARQDEVAACDALLPALRLFARRTLGADASSSEDFVQETLLVVLRALREGRVSGEALPAFALATCRGRMLDARRTAGRRAAALDALPTPAAFEQPVPELIALGRLLPTLEIRQRRVLSETFFQGRASAEIAERMGVSEANVRVLRHRALTLLRELLEESR